MFETDAFNRSLFFPRPDVSSCPAGARDVFVDVGTAADDARLHLRIYDVSPPAAARVPVLLFHGNGEIVSDYDDAAANFAQVGALLAVVDYRGYGASTGTPTLRAIVDDAHDVVDFFAEQVSAPFAVMGRSLGSACANHVYPAPHPRVRGVVLESGFANLEGLALRRNLSPNDIRDWSKMSSG